jgi:hypothetical protein
MKTYTNFCAQTEWVGNPHSENSCVGNSPSSSKSDKFARIFTLCVHFLTCLYLHKALETGAPEYVVFVS